MSSPIVLEIEHAIRTLNPNELQELYAWLDEYYPQAIDDRLPADLAAGKLDNAILRALDDEKNNRVQPL